MASSLENNLKLYYILIILKYYTLKHIYTKLFMILLFFLYQMFILLLYFSIFVNLIYINY